MNVHRIPTKVGTEIRLNEPFKCAKFQPDWSTNSRILRSVRNQEEKNEEIKTKFWSLVSTEIAGAIFFKFGM